MKWCLNANQTEEYLKKADELKIHWNNNNIDIINLIEINPKARILICPSFELNLVDKDYQWLAQQLILCKHNMAVIVSNDIQAKNCKKFNIPFFFVYPARTFLQLKRMQIYGATDAYIDDALCHSLNIIQQYYYNLNIRVIANSCGWGVSPETWNGIEGSWFRPEDLWKLNQIHVAEFHTNLNTIIDNRKQEQALYRIYAENHEWAGPVDKYVFDIQKKDILNRLLDDEFQEKRNNCRMKCMETNHCHYCSIKCNMALKENAKKIKENIKNE